MPQRRGFTLIEVLIALVIMGVVTGAIYQLLNTNQRLSLAQAEQVNLQSNVRSGSLVVPNELRELNTWLGGGADRNDVLAAASDGITYRAMRGLGFVCQAPAGNQLIVSVTSWSGLRDPDASRDDLYVFVDGPDTDEDDDDTWSQVILTGATNTAGACGASDGYVLTGAGAMPVVPLNTPVRVFERMRLELYSADGQWWLGASPVKPGVNLQPVLGPLTDDGLQLVYFNSAGAVTADLTAISSIGITVQGLTEDAVRAGGAGPMGHPEETLATQVLLRNSIRP